MQLYLTFNEKRATKQNAEFTEIKVYLTVTCSEAEVRCGQKVKQVFIPSASPGPRARNYTIPTELELQATTITLGIVRHSGPPTDTHTFLNCTAEGSVAPPPISGMVGSICRHSLCDCCGGGENGTHCHSLLCG